MAAQGSKYCKRSDGRYQTSITIGRKSDGTPKRKILYGATIKEVDRKLAAEMERLQSGLSLDGDKVTFAEMAEIWFKSYKPDIGVAMRKKYRTLLDKHLLPKLGDKKLRKIKAIDLQTILTDMAKEERPGGKLGYATGTMREVKTTAAQIMRVAVENDMLARNVFEIATVPKKEPVKRTPLTEEEQGLVLQNIEGNRMGICASIMLLCGLRRGEMLALTWKSIDLQKKEISVQSSLYFNGNQSELHPPKTQAGIRSVTIPDILLEHLHKAKKSAKSFIVCPCSGAEKAGQYMTQIAFKRAWQSYMNFLNIKAGGRVASRSREKIVMIRNLTPHMFRHTYTTNLYNAGVDVVTMQKMLGHRDIKTTLAIYTHLSEEKKDTAMNAYNQYLEGKSNNAR